LALTLAFVGVGCGSSGRRPAERAPQAPVVTSVEHRRPVALAADAAGVWILDERGRLARVNAKGDVVVAPRRATGPKLARDVDALVRIRDDLWVADARRGLLRFDAGTGRPRPGAERRARAVALAVSRSGLWAAHDFSGTLRRLDLDSLRLSRPVRIGKTLRSVAAEGSRVWAVDQDAGTLTSVDARRLTATGSAAADGTRPFHATAGGGCVWLSDDDGVTAYDAASLRRVSRWTTGPGSVPYVVADATGAWAVLATEPILVRLDHAARATRRIRLPSAGYSLAVGGGVVWVAGENVIHRVIP
jgi:hypothetical protein